jgi:two-component system alkaline phosphatase synthesis response regulator PhoP
VGRSFHLTSPARGLFEADAAGVRPGARCAMAREAILVVDDEQDILELLSYNLIKEGYRPVCATSGEQALAMARSKPPDLVVLDLMLPGVGGLEVCRHLKSTRATQDIPVVMLTARGEESDIVAGLELGADDYITKPFSPKVLVARVRAALRRKRAGAGADEGVVQARDLVVDPPRREVLARGKRVSLTYTEFGIVHLLVRRPGVVFTRNQIVEAVRGGDTVVTDRSVDVHIAAVRKKLGPCGRHIETVRGVGYRLRDE